MAAAKWFDLLDHNSKLERHGTGHGHYSLHLELDTARMEGVEDDELLDLGWVLDKDHPPVVGRGGLPRVKLENLRPITSAAEVGASLTRFFSNDELKASYTTQDAMRQNERMDGLQDRTKISEPELAEVIRDVSPENQSRIKSSVERAIAAVERRRARVSKVALEGQGYALVSLLSPALAEATKLPEDVAGRMVIEQIAQAVRVPPGEPSELREHLNNMADAITQRDEGALEAEGEWVSAKMTENISAWVANLKERALPEEGEDKEAAITRVARASVWQWDTDGLAEAEEAGLLTDYAFERVWEGSGMKGVEAVNVRYPLSERNTRDTIANRMPFNVKADNSIESQVFVNHLAAIERAMQFVGGQLGRNADNLVPDQKSVPLRFAFGDLTTSSSTKGQQVTMRDKRAPREPEKIEGEDVPELRAGLSIGVSIRSPWTFIHELGHLIDNGNGFSDAERRAIIEFSGALPDIEGRIIATYGREDDYGEYLLDEQEIFARMFAAAMRDACVEAGDPMQESLGGWLTNTYWHGFAGVTVEGSGARFINALRETLDSRRELSMSQRPARGADQDNEYDPPHTAAPAMPRDTALVPGG